MKTLITSCLLILSLLLTGLAKPAGAQSIELLAGNTLNGAVTGVALGGATVGLQNTVNYQAPLRVGLGLGTLYGVGVGAYDISRAKDMPEYYISATFNDGKNSSIIVLLDTFYGAAAGAVIASAVTLVINERVVRGLQYGASVGAWAGFGFGLVDAFSLAGNPVVTEPEAAGSASASADGLLTYTSADKNLGIGLLNPSLVSVTDISSDKLQQKTGLNMQVFNLTVNL